MRSLLLVLMLAALSASDEVVQEFHQVEEGVYILGSEESEEPLVVLQPEWDEKHVVTLQPEDGGGQPVFTLQPEGGGQPVFTLRPQIDEEAKILSKAGQGEAEKRDTRSNNFSVGTIGLWDIMLAHYNPLRQPVANQIIVMDIQYRGVALGRISFIRAIQSSGQLATARIIAGGLGMNFVTIRLTSARGSGFQYSIDIWGR